jgi:tetratricopeptide (TPR) repeat protein
MDPLDKEVAVGLAVSYQAVGDLDKAVLHLKKALMMGGQNIEIYLLLANIFLETGEYEEAAVYCNKVLKEEPDRPDARYLLGLAYEKMGLDEEADLQFKTLEDLEESAQD